MRPEMLRQIHKSHLGLAKCRQRAGEVLFWPGMSLDVEQMVTNCSVCADFAKKHCKPTVPPSLSRQKIGIDRFELQGEHYLLSVCYRSKFQEVTKMEYSRSSAVVEKLKTNLESMGFQQKWSEIMAPNSAAANFKHLRKSTVSSVSPVRRTTQRIMERRREPFRLSKIYCERTVTNIWPCLTIGLYQYQASNCRQHNCGWNVR